MLQWLQLGAEGRGGLRKEWGAGSWGLAERAESVWWVWGREQGRGIRSDLGCRLRVRGLPSRAECLRRLKWAFKRCRVVEKENRRQPRSER